MLYDIDGLKIILTEKPSLRGVYLEVAVAKMSAMTF